MPSVAERAVLHRHSLRRFWKSRKGSAALEFALVAPVFFGLLFAIIEAGIVFLAGQVLETITQDSARMIQTGQAQSAGYTQAQFASYVCSHIPALFNCSDVSVDVESFPSFSSVVVNNPVDGGGNFQAGTMQYNTGNACDIVVVRLFYQWPLIVTGFGFNPSNLAGNKRLLTATAAFRNEPYAGSACGS